MVSGNLNVAFQYAFNWVIVTTMTELSWTICVLTNSMTFDKYRKLKLATYIFALTISVVYMTTIFMIAHLVKGDTVIFYESIATIFYFIQVTIYIGVVCFCLLPAMKKLDSMLEERRSVLCQFILLVVCIFGRFVAQFLYMYADIKDKSTYQVHAAYLTSIEFFSMIPSFYMLLSHHKTFRMADVSENEDGIRGVAKSETNRNSFNVFSDKFEGYEASDKSSNDGATIALDKYVESSENVDSGAN